MTDKPEIFQIRLDGKTYTEVAANGFQALANLVHRLEQEAPTAPPVVEAVDWVPVPSTT